VAQLIVGRDDVPMRLYELFRPAALRAENLRVRALRTLVFGAVIVAGGGLLSWFSVCSKCRWLFLGLFGPLLIAHWTLTTYLYDRWRLRHPWKTERSFWWFLLIAWGSSFLWIIPFAVLAAYFF
jgi:hypothetical protein